MDPLIERARAGDPAAMGQLLQSVAPAVHRFGTRMCKHPQDSEDVLQDTLLAIATTLPQFEGRSSLLSWVFTLARTACIRRRRGMKNQTHASTENLEDLSDHAPTPEQLTSKAQLAHALENAIDALPEDYREALLLRDVEGLSASEAAEVTGISIDALKSRLHRARESLRGTLRPLLEPPLPTPVGCPDVVRLWSQKLEGELRSEDCKSMEAHLMTCPSCGAACEALKEVLRLCRSSSHTEVSSEVKARVQAAVRGWMQGLSALSS